MPRKPVPLWEQSQASPPRGHVLPLVGSSNARGGTFEVHAFNAVPDVVALANEVAEVFAGDFRLLLELGRLLPLALQFFDTALQTHAEFIRRVLEGLPHLRANTGSVGMRIIEQIELC